MVISTAKVWIFGGGGASSWILDGMLREGVCVSGILDDASDIIHNKKIISPSSPNITKSQKETDIVVVSILNVRYNIDDIVTKLKKLGWKNVMVYSEWCHNFYLETKRSPAPITFGDWSSIKDKIADVRDMLSDKNSIDVLNCFTNFVRFSSPFFPTICKNQYFPQDISKINEHINMIDCGAYTGDTILECDLLGYKINNVYAFEPDLNNYQKLVNNISGKYNSILFPCGVSDCTKQVYFESQSNSGSYINSDSGTLIQCVSIDDCLGSCDVNFIKMDIEGEEYNALLGAQKILKNKLPRLAISVYHTSTDIWKIPLFIKSIYGTNCKYYLRNHSRTIADTILYVVPE